MKLPFNIMTFVLLSLSFSAPLLVPHEAWAQQDVATIPEGSFHSVLPEVEGEPIYVRSFKLDRTAVTNRDFIQFLEENPHWRRSEIPPIYAGNDYLRQWTNDLSPGDESELEKPVTRVSWFAANAYCGWAGGRLPTLNEWEYAAQANDFESAAEADRFSIDLIGWYSAVNTKQSDQVGSTGIENRYGVQDMYGLIMEWVEDYNPPVADGISLDCGTIGRMKGDSSIYSYAMSIRYITRMSFRPTSTTGMLGFRCAYDIEPDTTEMEI
jgi:formylglycine-generating enzyme